jgi:hypothetical protein
MLSMRRGLARLVLAPVTLMLALAPGCGSDEVPVGTECDADAARTVVYRADGSPAYAGQAYVIGTCEVCHGERSSARQGAPNARIYGLSLASGEGDARIAELQRLLREQQTTFRDRDAVYGTVVHGEMPSGGWPVDPGYSSASGEALPAITTEEGQEILRNWLACGLPLVEGTTPTAMPCVSDDDCEVTGACDLGSNQCFGVGDVVPARTTTP